jgi:hypothetical protein
MRYLKQLTLNRRIANDQTLYTDGRGNLYSNPPVPGAFVVPVGTAAQFTATGVTPTVGMMRYTTDVGTNGELQIFQGGAFGSGGQWRSVRFKESNGITQQNLGVGDGNNQYFGPLNPAPPAVQYVQSGASWGGQNILVVVENVIQLNNTNYTVVQGPTIPQEVYVGTLSYQAASGVSTLYFNSSQVVTSASSSGTITVTGFITGTVLTVTSGSGILNGMTLSGGSGGNTIANGTIVQQTNVAVFTGSIGPSSTSLTVTSVTSGIIKTGMTLSGATAGTYVVSQSSGTTGGAGVYVVSSSQTLASTSITGTNYTVSPSQTITSVTITAAGQTAILGFATQPQPPFAVGASISVTGMRPVGFNGTYTVASGGSNASNVQFANTTLGPMTLGGTVTASTAIFPAVNLIPGGGANAIVSGSGIQGGTTVTGVSIDSNTGALLSITLSSPTNAIIPVNTSITITENARTASASDSYIYFSSPVPLGKPVTALIGFDK